MEYMLGVVVGALVGILLVAALLKWTKTDKSKKCRFDERQELVRGRGFKYAFVIMIIYYGVYGMLDLLLEKMFIETMGAMFFGMLLGVGVHVCYCVWNEGYVALNENPKRLRMVFTILAVFNILRFILEAVHGEVIVNGILQFVTINLACGIELIVIVIVMFAKEFSEHREND